MQRIHLSFVTVLIIWAAGVLPLYLQPMRVEPNEPHRAALVELLALATAAALVVERRFRLGKASLALLAFAALLLVTSLFALSPITALAGDLIRRFGALAQIAVLAGAVIGAWAVETFGGRTLARLLWMAGIVVTVMALLQQARLYPTISPTYYPLRSSATLGYPTYLGGWVALCVMVCCVYAPFRAHWLKQVVWWLGVAFVGAALIPAGARAGTLAAGAGALTLVVAYAAVRRWRWVVAVLAICVAVGAAVLPSLVGVEGIPLLQRLDLSVAGNATQEFREIIWERAMNLSVTFPALTDYTGEVDRYAILRPLIGYGVEMQEPLYRQFPYIATYTVDRAHNLWLDTLLTGGWLTFAARLALLLGIGGWALRRLGLLRPLVVISALLGVVIGGIATRESVWLSVSLTFGGIAGLWFGMIVHSLLPRAVEKHDVDAPALLALGSLVVFLVDMQLGFETAVVSLTFWLACGALFARRSTTHNAVASDVVPLVGSAVLGATALMRAIAYNAPNNSAMQTTALICALALISGLALAGWIGGWRWTRRGVLGTSVLLAVGFGSGWLGARPAPPSLAAAWDAAFVVMGSLLLAALSGGVRVREARQWLHISLQPNVATAALVVGAALLLWWVDTTGDIHFSRGSVLHLDALRADETQQGLALRRWDSTVWSLYGADALNEAIDSDDETRPRALTRARAALYAAAQMHAYDASNTLRLANLEMAYAQVSAEPEPHVERAAQLLEAAAAQDPHRWEVGFARATFAWHMLHDRETALAYVADARTLNADAPPLLALQAEIEQAQ